MTGRLRLLFLLPLLALLHLVLLAGQFLQSLPISARAQIDGSWSQLWTVFGQHIPDRYGSRESLARGIARSRNQDSRLLEELIRIALNFDDGSFHLEEYLRRYSHASAAGVERDLEALLALDWIRPNSQDRLELTPAGQGLVQQYQESWTASRISVSHRAPVNTAQELLPLLQRVVEQAAKMFQQDPLSPLTKRRAGRHRVSPEAGEWARLEQLFEDLLAFRNQVARERLSWLSNSGEGFGAVDTDLNGLETELLWGVAEGWADSQSDCLGRAFWRQTSKACQAALSRLESLSLTAASGRNYALQSKGAEWVQAADQIGNLVFYRSWNALSPQEYQHFTSLLDQLERALEL